MTRRAISLGLLLALTVSAAACGDDGDSVHAGAAESSIDTTTVTTAPVVTTTTPPVATAAPVVTTASEPATTVNPDPQPFGTLPPSEVRVVGLATEVFVDETRPTNAVEAVTEAAESRTLPTLIWYPALGVGRIGEPVAGAEPDIEGGPYPLIELSHGLTGYARQFDTLAPVLVAAGYVVVSPDFPETTGGVGFDAAASIVNQPGDVSFTIDSILALNDDPASRWHGMVDPSRIGIGGHSFGAMTTLLTLYNSAHTETRVDAAVAISGAEFPVAGGEFTYVDGPPLLLVHGDADSIVPYAGSRDVYAHAQAPKYLLTLKDQNHGSFFDADDPDFELFSQWIRDFFDVYVKGDSATALPMSIDNDAYSVEGLSAGVVDQAA